MNFLMSLHRVLCIYIYIIILYIYSLFYHKVLLNLPLNSSIMRVHIPFAWLEHLSALFIKAKVNLLHRTVHLTNSSTGLRQKLPRTVAFRLRKVHTLRPKELHPKVRPPGDGCDELPQMKSKNWGRFLAMYNPGLVQFHIQFHSISWLCASGSRRPREKPLGCAPWSRRRRRRIAFRKSFAWCECMHMGYGNSWNMGLGQSTPRKSLDIWHILASFVHTPLSQNWWEAKCNGLQILLTDREWKQCFPGLTGMHFMHAWAFLQSGVLHRLDEQLTRQRVQRIVLAVQRSAGNHTTYGQGLGLLGPHAAAFDLWILRLAAFCHSNIGYQRAKGTANSVGGCIFLGWVWYAYSSLVQRILVLSYFIYIYI